MEVNTEIDPERTQEFLEAERQRETRLLDELDRYPLATVLEWLSDVWSFYRQYVLRTLFFFAIKMHDMLYFKFFALFSITSCPKTLFAIHSISAFRTHA